MKVIILYLFVISFSPRYIGFKLGVIFKLSLSFTSYINPFNMSCSYIFCPSISASLALPPESQDSFP